MRTYSVVWFGQMVSLVGTGMSGFALLTWAYGQTGLATPVALLGLAAILPYVLVSPVAGLAADRVSRRRLMLIADLGAALVTLAMLLLVRAGRLEVPHLYVAHALGGLLQAFQLPAFVAATTQLVPPEHRQRAAGMSSFSEAVGAIAGPGLAGVLMRFGGLEAVLVADLVTFLVAAATLLAVRFPPLPSAHAAQERPAWHAEIFEAWRFIRARAGLLQITAWWVAVNFVGTLTWIALLGPMVLARSGKDPLAFAQVQSAMGFGSLVGSLALAAWGGPRRLIHGMLATAAVSFACGDLLLGLGRNVWVWSLGVFLGAAFIPPMLAANRALWQAKTPHALQGRVFSLQSTLRLAFMPLGYALAGPLADRVFEPAMRAGGPLAPAVGPLLGTGPGAGMALMFLCTGVLGMAGSLAGYAIPAVRRVQEDVPDADGAAPVPGVR